MGGNDDVIKNRIYIGRLPERTRESDLERFLRGYGDIKGEGPKIHGSYRTSPVEYSLPFFYKNQDFETEAGRS